jgi:hypothetical protein
MFLCYKLQQSFCQAKECDCAKKSYYFTKNHYLEQKNKKRSQEWECFILKVGCGIKNQRLS